MNSPYEKVRYNHNLGYRLLHVKGTNPSESVVHYLHHSQNYLIFYFAHVKGSIKIEGQNYELRDGDIIILNPAELFRLKLDDNYYHERISLSISEAMLAAFPDSCNELFSPFYNRKKGVGNHISAEKASAYNITECFGSILRNFQSSDVAAPLLTFCEITKLLKILNDVHKENTEIDSVQSSSHPLIRNVLNYLNLHYNEDLSIASVSEVFHINQSHLSHLFKEHMGMSLWNYVTFRRIQLFNELIKTNTSVESTCYLAGFRNYSNFFRLYKKYMNITPTEYKKQVQSGEKFISSDSYAL